jgi:hypothetical protein
MRLALSRGDRRLLVFAGAVLVLVIGAALVLGSGSSERSEVTTSYSAASAGTKAIYLMLAAAGYRVERWEEPPSALRDPASTTLILAEPLEMPTESDRRAIVTFMEAGGRVIATGPASAWFISGSTRMRTPSGRTWMTVTAIAPTPVTAAAPEITVAERAGWTDSGWLMLPLYGDPSSPSVVDISVGRGGAMWIEAATPFTNAGISASGNLAFALASVGTPGGRRILFDEYFHGRRRTLAASIWHSPTKWIGVQLGILCVAVLLTFARRSGPIIPPAVESRLSPLEFVRTLGSLYERAGASSVVVDAAERRARYWLARRFGVSARGSADEIAEAVARRTGRNTAALADALRACASITPLRSIGDKRALAIARVLGQEIRSLRVFGPTTEDV